MKLPAIPKSVFPSSLVKTVLVCAVFLCFAAVAPAAFAQRGGGGSHGGGGRASAGSRGGVGGFRASSGSRVSTGSAGRASGASRSYASSGTLYAHGTSARGYSRNTFVPGPGSRAVNGANSSFSVNSPSPVGARPFAANNFLWEDPPQQARPVMPMQSPRPMMPMQSPRPIFAPMQTVHLAFPAQPVHFPFIRQPNALASPSAPSNALFHPLSRRLVAGPPFVGMAAASFHSLHFRRQPCFGTVNPCGFGGGGFGFGSPFFFDPFFLSSFGFGFGSPCFFAGVFEPCAFGLGPFGLEGNLLGYDYGNGYFYSPAEEPPPPWNADEDTAPAEFPTYSVEYPFLPAPLPPPVPYSGVGQGTAAQPVVKLVLKDGTVFGVNYYWLADGRLNYITTYNIQTSIPLDDLDLQKTVDLNYKLGITFTLTPQPPTSPQPPDAQSQPQNQ
ncbi:MAG: hypothetical protein WBD87_09425 [Candidatus Acidiferrales bacterium]